VKIACPLDWSSSFLLQFGSSCRVHYRGFVGGKRVYERQSLASNIRKNGNNRWKLKRLVLLSLMKTMRAGWDLNPNHSGDVSCIFPLSCVTCAQRVNPSHEAESQRWLRFAEPNIFDPLTHSGQILALFQQSTKNHFDVLRIFYSSLLATSTKPVLPYPPILLNTGLF